MVGADSSVSSWFRPWQIPCGVVFRSWRARQVLNQERTIYLKIHPRLPSKLRSGRMVKSGSFEISWQRHQGVTMIFSSSFQFCLRLGTRPDQFWSEIVLGGAANASRSFQIWPSNSIWFRLKSNYNYSNNIALLITEAELLCCFIWSDLLLYVAIIVSLTVPLAIQLCHVDSINCTGRFS